MTLNGIICLLGVSAISFGVMASPDVTVFFPDIRGNLTNITWAHAVNNLTYLTSTLSNNNVMMIEADVILGTLNNTNTTIPVMGHPPANTSDLSLETFLATINQFNTNNSTNTTRKGVKLDFKTIEVFNASVSLVRQYDQGRYPLWINADIAAGPINATTVPVNASQFLQYARQFNNTVLSIGWTTNFGGNLTGNYTTEQINFMLTAISQNNVTQNITFPVRAGLAAESIPQMRSLLQNVTRSTLTLWSSEGDNVSISNLRNLIAQVGVQRTFVDVPESLRGQLRLHELPSSASGFGASVVVSLVLAVLTRFM